MTTYWRFTIRPLIDTPAEVVGEICGPCAWVLAYMGYWMGISVHESSKLMIACVKCRRNMWTVASHTLPVVAA